MTKNMELWENMGNLIDLEMLGARNFESFLSKKRSINE